MCYIYQEYSPDLANISKKEKKSQLGGDGITITSIKHKGDGYQPGTDTNNFNNSPRTSRVSTISTISNNDPYDPPASQPAPYSNAVEETQAEVDHSRWVVCMGVWDIWGRGGGGV